MTEATDATEPRSALVRVRSTGAGWVRSIADTTTSLPAGAVGAIGERLDRVLERVVRQPAGVATSAQLTASLQRLRDDPGGAGSLATLLASSALAGRTIRLGARRLPAIAAVTGSATALTIVARGLREVRLLASHLVHRARAEGIEVDAAALRSIVLQIYLRPDDAPSREAPPSMLTARVASGWVRRATSSVLPFVPERVGGPAVARWVAAAGRVDVHLLAR